MQERQHRWKQIELLCNFQIVTDGLFHVLPEGPPKRKSSIMQALTECANLGSMGSLSNLGYSNRDNNRDSVISEHVNTTITESDQEREILSASPRSIRSVSNSPDPDSGVTRDIGSSHENGLNGFESSDSAEKRNGGHVRMISNVSNGSTTSQTSVGRFDRAMSEQTPTNRVTERCLNRAYTEPGNLSRMAMANSANERSSRRSLPRDVQIVRSSENVIANGSNGELDTPDKIKMRDPKLAKLSSLPDKKRESWDCSSSFESDGFSDIISYQSDDSATSPKEAIVPKEGSIKKKKRGLRKIFSKKKQPPPIGEIR